MEPSRSRRILRVVVLGVATCMLSLSGGAPSWTDSIQPRPDGPGSAPAEVPAGRPSP